MWLYTDVLGVATGEAGSVRLRLDPAVLRHVGAAAGRVPTPWGPVQLAWALGAGGRLAINATLPAGPGAAQLHLPCHLAAGVRDAATGRLWPATDYVLTPPLLPPQPWTRVSLPLGAQYSFSIDITLEK